MATPPAPDAAPLAPSATGPQKGWTGPRYAWASAGLLALYLFLATFHLSRIPLLDPDEPRYATAARTMAEGGSWLIPQFNEEPRYNKPPLFYWLVALSHRLIGPGEVSARVPSIAMGLLMLALTVYAGCRLYDPATAFSAGLILCTAPLFMALSRTCVIDQTLSTLVAAGLVLFLLRLTGRLAWDPLIPIGALLGLAFMAKGPAATLILIVPLIFVLLFARQSFLRSPGALWAAMWLVVGLVGLAWLAVQKGLAAPNAKLPPWALASFAMAALSVLYYGLRPLFAFPAWPLALALALGLGAWWYLALWAHIGSEKFLELLRFEILGRLSGDVHEEPYAFYLYIFPAVFFPWSLALPSAVGCAWRRVDPPLPLAADDATPTANARRNVSDSFLVAWLIGVVLFFSVPVAKLATYVLPAFPAAALLTARFLRRWRSDTEPIPRGWIVLVSLLGGVVVLGLASVSQFENMFKRDAQETLQNLPIPLWTLGLAVGLLTGAPWIAAGMTRRSRVVLVALPAFVLLLVTVAVPLVFERSEFLNTSRDLTAVPEVQAYAGKAHAVYAIGWPEESLVWYTRRGVHGVLKKDRNPKESLTESLQKALDEHPPGTVLLFAHRAKFKAWFKPENLVRIREVAGNSRVAVLVNENTGK